MNLINQVIEKKLLKFDEEFINNKGNFWDLYQVINLSNAILPMQINKHFRNRNRLWKRILKGNEKAVLQIRDFIYKDRENVYKCLAELKLKEEPIAHGGNLWKKGRFAIAEYEYA